MELLKYIMEFLTIIVSLIGVVISIHHSEFFRRGSDKFSKKMHKNFFWDSMVYLITLLMGIGLFFDISWFVHFNVIVRPVVLVFAVWASLRLYKHYRKVNK